MKYFAICVLVLFTYTTFAQPEKKLTATTVLKLPEEQLGKNATISWNPTAQVYVSIHSDSATYSIHVFAKDGQLIKSEKQKADAQICGVWYNKFKNELQANLYGRAGWVKWNLNEKGIPQQVDYIFNEMIQPDDESVGFYDEISDIVYFLYGSAIYYFDATTGAGNNNVINLYIGYTPKEISDDKSIIQHFNNGDIQQGVYNSTNAVLVFANEKATFGMLNIEKKQIELYSKKTGMLETVFRLPSEISGLPEKNNFGYCNGRYWIYSSEINSWMAFEDMTNSLPVKP